MGLLSSALRPGPAVPREAPSRVGDCLQAGTGIDAWKESQKSDSSASSGLLSTKTVSESCSTVRPSLFLKKENNFTNKMPSGDEGREA